MSNPWNADIHIDQPLARELISKQFPELDADTLKPFGQGWDNAAYLVEDRYIFRFPRRLKAVPLLQSEILLLPTLAQYLSVTIPNPTFKGKPSESYPYVFAGYAMLEGTPACAARLSPDQKADLAVVLGEFLSQLHNLSARATQWSPPSDPFQRTDLPVLSGKIEKGLLQLKSHLGDALFEKATSFTRLPRSFSPTSNTLVHGDLYVRHLLVDANNALNGIIDWGDLHMGERAVDLGLAWNFLPRTAHDTFLKAYGPSIRDQDWEMARLRGLFHGVALLQYGLDTDDQDLVREGRFIFDNVLD